MKNKERGLAPFTKQKMDRFPMWYGADPKLTENLIKAVGAEDEEDALYNIIGIDYKTIRPEYVGEPLKKHEDGSVDTVWGIRRNGYYYGMSVTHPMSEFDSVKQVEKYKFPNPLDFDLSISDKQMLWAENH